MGQMTANVSSSSNIIVFLEQLVQKGFAQSLIT